MRMFAYSVFDRKTLSYGQPFFAHQDGAAVRILSDAANDQQTMIGKHPEDFVLFKIGLYDDQLGQLIPVAPIEHVIDVSSLFKTATVAELEWPADQKARG